MSPRLEATGSHAGFQYCAMIMPMGHRCGYVRIPENHPWYGKHRDRFDADVHGGITFAEFVRKPNNWRAPWPCEGFWVGFDCAHSMDAPDFDEMSAECLKMYKTAQKVGKKLGEALLSALGLEPEEWQKGPEPVRKLRRRVYVEGQCKQLAAQAFDVAKEAIE